MSKKWMGLTVMACLVVGVAWVAGGTAVAEECDPPDACAEPIDEGAAEGSPDPVACALTGCQVTLRVETPDGYRDIVMSVSFSEDGESLGPDRTGTVVPTPRLQGIPDRTGTVDGVSPPRPQGIPDRTGTVPRSR